MLIIMIKSVYKVKVFLTRCINRVASFFRLALLAKHGKHCRINQKCQLTYRNIEMGNRCSLGPECLFLSTRARIIMGDDVMVAPRVTMITGAHRIDIKGRTMNSVHDNEKLPENDQDIVLEGDNWICANSTILKGVTIGKGSVVMAGAVVTKSIPQYEIFFGGDPLISSEKDFQTETLVGVVCGI